VTIFYPDIRRPMIGREDFLKSLAEDHEIFETMRDALVFAAAVGFSHERREEFVSNPNSIAWSTMAGNQFFEQVLLMITASISGETPEQLGESGMRERAKAFEEFACGGLTVIKEEMSRGLSPEDAVLSLIGKRITELNSGEFNPFDEEPAVFEPFV